VFSIVHGRKAAHTIPAATPSSPTSGEVYA
jgi:hypothetical protein